MAPGPEPVCARCSARLRGAFCGRCGAPAPARHRPRRVPGWVRAPLVGVVLLVVGALVVLPSNPPMPGETLNAPPGDDPDAPPRGRFQQLVDQVSAAVERGNGASVRELTAQALTTFAMIPPEERDVDSRYHAAMLRAVAGDRAGALAEADTILAAAPGNLFGYYVRGVVARLQGDSAGVRAAQAAFSARYRVESAKARPEYFEHRQLLEAFLRQP